MHRAVALLAEYISAPCGPWEGVLRCTVGALFIFGAAVGISLIAAAILCIGYIACCILPTESLYVLGVFAFLVVAMMVARQVILHINRKEQKK